VIAEIRGEGLMLGIKCKVPNTQLVAAALEEKLLTIGAGDNVVRLIPPLILNEADVNEAIAKLEKAAQRIEAKLA
jgi:acetylornithine/N-succinyldiaminopimelate aminotransferase